MDHQDIPPEIADPLRRAAALEPLFAVDRGVLDRIAAATAPTTPGNLANSLGELVLTLVEGSTGGLRPAYRAGVNPTHAVRKMTFAAGGLRLSLMLDPGTPGLPLDLPAAYRVLGRVLGAKAMQDCAVRFRSSQGVKATTLDSHGFFELTLDPGVYRLEIALSDPETQLVVPQLDVGTSGVE